MRSEYERVYTLWGRVAHLMLLGSEGAVLCQTYTQPRSWWFGIGDQNEIDRAARMPLCRKCEQSYVTLAALNYGKGSA